jgi:hypothetical protein
VLDDCHGDLLSNALFERELSRDAGELNLSEEDAKLVFEKLCFYNILLH